MHDTNEDRAVAVWNVGVDVGGALGRLVGSGLGACVGSGLLVGSDETVGSAVGRLPRTFSVTFAATDGLEEPQTSAPVLLTSVTSTTNDPPVVTKLVTS